MPGKIERHYGSPAAPPFAGAFEAIVWEIVAYLASGAARLQVAAQLTVDQFGGDLHSVLKLPPQKAKKLLMQYPMTSEPGAEKILMFAGALAVLALESNDCTLLTKTHLLLRQHGQRLCLRNGPVCHACPVRIDCRFWQGQEKRS